MTDIQKLRQKMVKRFELENKRKSCQALLSSAKDSLRQAKFDLREAQSAQLNYRGIRAMKDKLSGSFEEKQETLRREVTRAEAALRQWEREVRRLTDTVKELEEALAPLLTCPDPIAVASALPDSQRQELLALELQLTAGRLLPILDENQQALTEALEAARPGIGFAEEIRERRLKAFSRADGLAEKSLAMLEHLNSCGADIPIHPYFQNPAGYILGVAQEFKQLDRLNEAILAVRKLRKQIAAQANNIPDFTESFGLRTETDEAAGSS